MPSAKILEQKKAEVAALAEKMKNATAGVLVSYEGINVEQDTAMRAALRAAGVDYKVYKNTMTGRACDEVGYESLKPLLVGMTALAISENDPVSPAKVLKEYSEKVETFEIKGGFLDGEVIDANTVRELAEIPSKETLVCKIMLGVQSPVYGLAYALQAIIDKSGESVEEAAPEAE